MARIVYSVSNIVTVKNVNGSSKRSPKCPNCGNWIEHWKNLSKLSIPKCCVEGCNSLADVGAHVVRPLATVEFYRTNEYIVPMCNSHNGHHGESFKTKASSNVTFVRANVAESCGKTS